MSPMLSSIAAVDAEPDKVASIRLPAATCMSSSGSRGLVCVADASGGVLLFDGEEVESDGDASDDLEQESDDE